MISWKVRYLKTRISQQLRFRLSLTWIFFKIINTEDFAMIVRDFEKVRLRISSSNFSVPEEIKNSTFWDSKTSINMEHQWPEKHKSYVYWRFIRKLMEYSFKKVNMMAMFTLDVFEILLFKGRSVLWIAVRERINCSIYYSIKPVNIKSTLQKNAMKEKLVVDKYI